MANQKGIQSLIPMNVRPVTNRAIFLDRDGTIIEERKFLHRSEDVCLITGAEIALQRLQSAGFFLFIVSNQSGVGRGFFTMTDVESVNKRLKEVVYTSGVKFQKIYIAPERPEEPSYGRKPSPQFLNDARNEFNLELALSYMIGDKLSDLECGWNAGVKSSILVRTGYGAETERQLESHSRLPIVVDDLSAAADWILRIEDKTSEPTERI
jgi:D-glycero-D-manno-heptose 1,7-bisphosphate phosphatase